MGYLIDLPAPRSAWLLKGDKASYPSRREQSRWNSSDASGDRIWTCSPHVDIGDTLFFYFVAPQKAIHFVGRATSQPFYDRSIGVNALSDVSPHQWWVEFSAIVEINPITPSEINHACRERLVYRGRSGKVIAPRAANELLGMAQVRFRTGAWTAAAAFQPVVGRWDLPSSKAMTLKELRDLPSGLLRLELEVETYIVEPFLRLAGLTRAPFYMVPRYRIGPHTADYALFCEGKPICIVEAKRRVRIDRMRNWSASRDVRQAEGYANRIGRLPFMLIDCSEVLYFDAGASEPSYQLTRNSLTAKDLAAVVKRLQRSLSW